MTHAKTLMNLLKRIRDFFICMPTRNEAIQGVLFIFFASLTAAAMLVVFHKSMELPVVYFHTGDNKCWKVDPPSAGTCEDLPDRYHLQFCAPEAWHEAADRFRRVLPADALDETHAVLESMELHPRGPDEFYAEYMYIFTATSREEMLDGLVQWKLDEERKAHD